MSDTNIQVPPTPGPHPSGLPPVAPPSGRFIVQLFLVPGLIVGVLVLVLLTGKWIFGDRSSPEAFLKGLDDPNPEVRWRTAADLAQYLPRDPALALNTKFALDLTERLARARESNRASEKVHQEQTKTQKEEPAAVPRTLQAERAHIWYLTGCLGHFQVPVTVPLLQEIALDKADGDAESIFRRRSLALQALWIAGDNVRKFDRLSAEKKDRVLEDLKAESDSGSIERRRWAADTLAFLEARQASKQPNTLRVAETLIDVTRDEVAFLRKQAAIGLNFWDGDRVDEALLRLLHDDGKGEEPVEFDKEEREYRKAHPEELVRLNRKDIAYCAAQALARRGSPAAEGLFDLYEEMLDLQGLENILKSEWKKGPEKANAVQVVISTLSALDQLHTARKDINFQPDALDALVKSDNKAVSASARELQSKLK